MQAIPGQSRAFAGAPDDAMPFSRPSAPPALVRMEGPGPPGTAPVGRRPRSARVRLLQAASAGFVSVLLLALAIQGPWNANVLAFALSAVEASEGEEVATPSAIERIRHRRPQDSAPAPPLWAMPRLDENQPLRAAFRSGPVFVDSRSGKQRVYLLRHLLI